jgi:uncharacterized protein YutE (UPF0331/DUF86 family)
MDLEARLLARLDELLQTGPALTQRSARGHHGLLPADEAGSRYGWLTAAKHLVHSICPLAQNAYRIEIDRWVEGSSKYPHSANSYVAYVLPILAALRIDIKNGLLAEVVDSIRGETFDIMLDHAEEYHKKGVKEGSGVLVSAVFEDTIRRIAERNGSSRDKLDQAIDALRAAGVLTPVKANRCEAAAGLRNKALHAQWDEYDLRDVGSVIRTTRELIEDFLSG